MDIVNLMVEEINTKLSVRNCFIRGSVVRYVQLPPEGVDIELLHDATRREARGGLKDLADFLPASLVTIASYFSAEDTRDIWKPAFMDGTDWISPAANLALVEQQIKKILAATGVDVPSLDIDGNSPATLPLPLAAFVSLTITYKLDKATERFLALIAPAVSALASGCSWPSLPIVTSLWIQMVKRWSNYFVLSASSTVFHHNKDAIVQLLKSCFTSTLGLGYGSIYNNSVTDIASSDLMPKGVVRKPSLGSNKFLLVALKQGFGLPYPWVGPELDGGVQGDVTVANMDIVEVPGDGDR
ncbi:hypothetical protein JHK86_053558 [Glycine max]|nr:hypothetical protein JHK86_053558 [Glycine max]